ncbi:hypothetical protein IFM89_010627, partial [Coptis chinensis]
TNENSGMELLRNWPDNSSKISNLGSYKSFAVGSRGLSGGLWCFWDENLDVQIAWSDSWIVHTAVNDFQGNFCKVFAESSNVLIGAVISCWRCLFPNAKLSHIPTMDSDHKLLLLDCAPRIQRLRKPFRFETMWITDPSYKDAIQEAMQPGSAFSLCRHLDLCRRSLQHWNIHHFGNVNHQLAQIRKTLQTSSVSTMASLSSSFQPLDDLIQRRRISRNKDSLLLKRLHMHWAQKARTDTLLFNELNMRFFHATAICRRHNSHIYCLFDGNGNTLTSHDSISSHFIQHFQSIMTSANPTLDTELLGLIPVKVDDQANNDLLIAGD